MNVMVFSRAQLTPRIRTYQIGSNDEQSNLLYGMSLEEIDRLVSFDENFQLERQRCTLTKIRLARVR